MSLRRNLRLELCFVIRRIIAFVAVFGTLLVLVPSSSAQQLGPGSGSVTGPGGLNCHLTNGVPDNPSACSITVPIGFDITLTATADTDSLFIAWIGSCAAGQQFIAADQKTANVTFTFAATTTCNAIFKQATVDLAIIKEVEISQPSEGDTIVYTLTFVNNGLNPATNVIVMDLLPAGLTCLSFTPGSSIPGAAAPPLIVSNCPLNPLGTPGASTAPVLTLPILNPGTPALVRITARVDNGTAGQSLINTASISADQPDANPNDNNDSVTISVQQNRADLLVFMQVDSCTWVTVTTTCNGLLDVPGTMRLRVHVGNGGPGSASNAKVALTLPKGVTYVTNSAQPLPGTFDTQTNVWSIDTLAQGAEMTLMLQVSSTPGQSSNIVANISADQIDPDPSNNSFRQNVGVKAADLAVSLSVSDARPNFGDTISLTVTITNSGPHAVTPPALTLAANGLIFNSNAATTTTTRPAIDFLSVTSSTSATFLTREIPPGGTVSGTDTGTAIGGGVNANASVNASFPTIRPQTTIHDPVSTNDFASVNFQVQNIITDLGIGLVGVEYQDGNLKKTVTRQGLSSISKITTQPVDPGSTVTISIFILNNLGVGNVSGATLQIILPQGMTAGAGTPSQFFNSATNSWALPDLPGGGFATITQKIVGLAYQATIDSNTGGQTLTVQLSLTSGSRTDPNPANNNLKIIIPVRAQHTLTITGG